jgi:CpeT protein
MNFRYLPIAIMLSSCASAATTKTTVPATRSAPPVAVDAPAQLARLLIGTFDSAAQSATDAENYKPISLKICEVTAPTLGPKVLYVEQAVQTALDKPYRQRLYVIEAGADAATAISRVLELKNPVPAVGLCDKPERATFVAADAEEKIGCAVVMALTGEGFTGGTKGNGCPSALRGASYATSEVTLNDKGMQSWDRGYDTAGAQVWGAEKGAYIFVRK